MFNYFLTHFDEFVILLITLFEGHLNYYKNFKDNLPYLYLINVYFLNEKLSCWEYLNENTNITKENFLNCRKHERITYLEQNY